MRKTTLGLLLFALSFPANAEDELRSLTLTKVKGEGSDRAIPANISTASELGGAATYIGAEHVTRIPYQSYQQLSIADNKNQWQLISANWRRELPKIAASSYTYISGGFAHNKSWRYIEAQTISSDDTKAELNKIYYDSSNRLYVEIGRQFSRLFGIGLRLLVTENDYYVGDGKARHSSPSDSSSANGFGYGIYFNLPYHLILGVNQVGLTAGGLQFDNINYHPGVITETILGINYPLAEGVLFGFEYLHMSEENDQLRANDSGLGVSLGLRHRFGG